MIFLKWVLTGLQIVLQNYFKVNTNILFTMKLRLYTEESRKIQRGDVRITISSAGFHAILSTSRHPGNPEAAVFKRS